jgi:hypothetical protein
VFCLVTYFGYGARAHPLIGRQWAAVTAGAASELAFSVLEQAELLFFSLAHFGTGHVDGGHLERLLDTRLAEFKGLLHWRRVDDELALGDTAAAHDLQRSTFQRENQCGPS